MTYILGLTGSIGMGKSTTAAMFADAGIPVWDADAAVRELYAPDGAAAQLIGKRFPEVMDGLSVSRQKLRVLIADDPKILDIVQSLVHPEVAKHRQSFLDKTDARIVVLDIPLLFEGGVDTICDGIAVVSTAPELQKQRVLARGEMTEAEFEIILSRQMPDAEKRERATWVIPTHTLDETRQHVRRILSEIEAELPNA